jgi:hypothetical protein
MGYNDENEGSFAKSILAYRFFPIFKKNLFLQPHINSKERYIGGIMNFVPKLKLSKFLKKVLNFKVKI